MPITALPTPPNRTMTDAAFSAAGDAFMTALPTFATEANTLQTDVNTKQALAASSATNAATSESNAAASAASAVATSTAGKWVSGNYTQGNCAWSPINFLTYRRTLAGTTSSTTDPSTDLTNWALVTYLPNGQGGASITSNITLVASSSASMVVTPTSAGLYATLPVATGSVKGMTQFAIFNAGEFDYGIKNSAGVQLGWIRAGKGATIGLTDSSTAAGIWSLVGVEKLGITAALSLPSGLASQFLYSKVIAVDATRNCIFYAASSGAGAINAVCHDASTGLWGTPVNVAASSLTSNYQAILTASNQILVVTSENAPTISARVLTLSGTTITPATAVTVTPSTAIGLTSPLVIVGSSIVYGYVRPTSTVCLRAITISGTVPTIGAETIIIAATGTSPYAPNLFASGATIIRTVCGNVGTGLLYCTPYTISAGTTLTVGTQVTGTLSTGEIRAIQNGNGNIVAQYSNSDHRVSIFKLTGTVEAISTVTAVAPITGAVNLSADMFPISASKTLLSTWNNATFSTLNILTDTSGAASIGSSLSLTAPSTNAIPPVYSNGTTVRVIASTVGNSLTALNIDCSGTTPALLGASYRPSVTNGISALAPSSLYGVRASNGITVGSTTHVLSSTQGFEDVVITPNSMVAKKSRGAFPSMPGAYSNDAWGLLSYNTTGLQIQRIEAVA